MEPRAPTQTPDVSTKPPTSIQVFSLSSFKENSIYIQSRGHRRQSFVALDLGELIELRARQRTFDGATSRTALSNLGYSLSILRFFNKRFHSIGLLYLILAVTLFFLAFIRARHSNHDFSDINRPVKDDSNIIPASQMQMDGYSRKKQQRPIQTIGQCGPDKRTHGRPFVTAGHVVIAVSIVVAAAEIAIFILIIQV